MLKIITTPNAVLNKKSKSIKKIDTKIAALAEKMTSAIASEGNRIGVGLSAVQIGQLIRLFVVFDLKTKKNHIFVNPKITWQSKALTTGVPESDNPYEGCLSVPKIFGKVKRHQSIKIRWQDLNGQIRMGKFTGFVATVIQHEYDHINGVLFTQRVLEQKDQLYKLEKEKGQEVLIPINLK